MSVGLTDGVGTVQVPFSHRGKENFLEGMHLPRVTQAGSESTDLTTLAGTPSKVQRCTPSSLSSPQPGGELIQRRLRAASRRDTKGLGEENPDHTYPGAVSGKGMVKFPFLCAVHSRCLIDVY